MAGHRKESVAGVLISGVIGIVVFLIVLAVLNILAGTYVQAPVFLQLVEFLNANLGLLILISALFLVGDLFGALPIPMSLPGPVFFASGAVLLVIFLVRLFLLIGEITGVGVFSALEEALSLPVYLLVLFLPLIARYIGLFTDRA